jgi:glyoxylase-like metal-dependent hydrolase (beta-lactamase superfamily II)
MNVTQVVPGLWQVKISFVNAYLLGTPEGLVLIDTGIPGSAPTILDAIRSIGQAPTDIHQILLTHCHVDHAGSLAALKQITGATAAMHPLDAAMVRTGNAKRPLKAAPGLANALISRLILLMASSKIDPTEIEHEISDGDTLVGGLKAIHVPGHCAGQLAFLWPQHGGVLIAADAAANVFGLGLSPMYENLADGLDSLKKLAALDFEVACFGHGKVIPSNASALFRREWPVAPKSARQPV